MILLLVLGRLLRAGSRADGIRAGSNLHYRMGVNGLEVGVFEWSGFGVAVTFPGAVCWSWELRKWEMDWQYCTEYMVESSSRIEKRANIIPLQLWHRNDETDTVHNNVFMLAVTI